MHMVDTKARIATNSQGKEFDEREIITSFGVGCFHFGQRQVSPVEEFDTKMYVDEVRAYLSHYTNIESISTKDLRYTKFWDADDEEYDNENGWLLNDSDGIRPWPVDWSFEFVIQIPERIQEQILLEFSSAALETNRFRISIRYEGGLPVAFIRGDRPLSKPSNAVILIGEYLKRNGPKDSPIDFQLLGPSPFHAEFYVLRSEEEGFERDHRPGYDHVCFTTSKSVQSFYDDIEPELAQELGHFYGAIQRRNLFANWWGDFSVQIGKDIEALKQPRSLVRRMLDFVRPPEFNDRALELIEYEIMVTNSIRSYAKRLQEISTQYGLDRFSDDVSEVMAAMTSNEVDQFRTIVGVLESHRGEMTDYRVSLMAAFIGLISACIGGVVGALVTLSLR